MMVPVYKTVKDTRLARKMFPDFIDNEDGTLEIITTYIEDGLYYQEYFSEGHIVNLGKGLTFIGTPKK